MKEQIILTPIAENFIIEKEEIQVYPLMMEMQLEEGGFLKNKAVYIIEGNDEDSYEERFEFGVFKKVIEDFSFEEIEKIKNKVRIEVARELNSNALVPLKEWFCDACEEVITKEEKALLQFHYRTVVESGEMVMTGFRIVHEEDCAVVEELENPDGVGSFVEIPISNLEDRMSRLLALKEEDNFENEEDFSEIMKRIEVPYYEEARKYAEQIENGKYSLDSSLCKYDRKYLRGILMEQIEVLY